LYKKIASNTLSQILSKVLTALISIFLIGILTKGLPIELYGSYNKVFSYLGIFAFLADLWLYTITVREISNKKVSSEKIIWNVLTLRILLSLCIWVLALGIAFFLPGYNDFYTFSAIAVIGLFTSISLINSSLLALMQAYMKMEFSLVSIVLGKLLNISLVAGALLYVFTWSGDTYLAFISVFIAATLWILLTTVLNYIYARKICRIRLLYDREYMSHIFKISLPYGIALFLSVVYFKIDIILLSFLEAPDKADISIALYGLPMKMIEVLMVLGGFYLNSLLPTLTESFRSGKQEKISKILWISLKLLASFWLLILLMVNLFWVDLISVIATPEYLYPSLHNYNSMNAFSLSSWVLLLHFIALAYIYILIANERQSLLLKINIFVTLVNVIGNILLIPHFSFIGAAITTLVSQGILMLVSWYIVLKDIRVDKIYFRHIMLSCAITLALFIGLSFIFSLTTFSSMVTLIVFWPITLWLFVLLEYICSRKLLYS